MVVRDIILRSLREDARQSIRKIAQDAKLPKSTVFDHYRSLPVRRYASILDLDKLAGQHLFAIVKDIGGLQDSPYINMIGKVHAHNSEGHWYAIEVIGAEPFALLDNSQIVRCYPVEKTLKKEGAEVMRD